MIEEPSRAIFTTKEISKLLDRDDCHGLKLKEPHLIPPLLMQLSLHLPKYSLPELTSDILKFEYKLHHDRLLAIESGFRSQKKFKLNELGFEPIQEKTAETVMSDYHYLKSHRRDSKHFGLVAKGRQLPVALCSISKFDLDNIHGIPLNNARNLSRVFAFDCVPKNTISYLLARTRHWLLENEGVTDYITMVNPNIGFTGSSYKADNWIVIGKESGTRYAYVKGIYKTDREIYGEFGETIDNLLLTDHPDIQVSKTQLLPLLVFFRSTQTNLKIDKLKEFERWKIRA